MAKSDWRKRNCNILTNVCHGFFIIRKLKTQTVKLVDNTLLNILRFSKTVSYFGHKKPNETAYLVFYCSRGLEARLSMASHRELVGDKPEEWG